MLGGRIEDIEALVQHWIDQGLIQNPGLRPITLRETLRLVLMAQRAPISIG